ncbi:MAG: hypothetical protein JWM02_568 [Frankiales bacterium]|nr:hypothetical protein [Frankiales bacterium]
MDGIRTPAALADVATEQCGVLRRSQFTAYGVSIEVIRSQLRAQRWQEVGPVVIALHNGPLTPEQQTWAAMLSAPGLVAVAGRHAASEYGLTSWDGPVPEIVVPRGHHLPALPFPVRVHESRRFAEEDVHPARSPYRTRLERSIIDAATWTPSPRAACGLLAAAVQQRLTQAERLAVALDKVGSVRHCAVMRAVLNDVAGGAQALSEVEFGRFLLRNGLPSPRRQVVRLDGAGRRRYLDVELEGTDGTVLHLELDGALHLLVATYWQDMDRGNEMVISGGRLLRYPSISWRLEEARVADQIRRGLAGATAGRLRAA